jgi:hypothetical protein
MECKEQYFENIGSLTAYPTDAVSVKGNPWSRDKYVATTAITFAEGKAIRVPMKRKTGTMSEKSNLGTGGRYFEVSVKWEVEDRSQETLDTLSALRDGSKVLRIKFFEGDEMVVRPWTDGYLFHYYENGDTIECELTIVNLCGAQHLK